MNKIAQILYNVGVGGGLGIVGLSAGYLTKEFYQYVKKSPLCVIDVLAKGLEGRRDSPFE